MIHLKSIKVKGFKDAETVKKLTFSTEPITVIYGENGCGKTTLLKILFAVLDKRKETLLEENVIKIELKYTCENANEKTIIIQRKDNGDFDWGNSIELQNTSSILFGVHRGVIQEQEKDYFSNKFVTSALGEIHDIVTNYVKNSPRVSSKQLIRIIVELQTMLINHDELNKPLLQHLLEQLASVVIRDRIGTSKSLHVKKRFDHLKNKLELYLFENIYQNEERNFLKKINNQHHLATDFVRIEDIQSAIVSQYNKGQEVISEKIKNAFFETIEKAVDIDESNEEFTLPDDFEKRIEDNKEFILKAIVKQDSSLAARIRRYIETKDRKLTDRSNIFRAMLLDIIESAEESNPALESITKLIEVFNAHLYKNKKLVVDGEKAYIDLGKGKFHELSKLSSGERNLLSILTLFLIIGHERSFLMIDEPEVSLNLKWQREFLPLLNKLNAGSQIIVASHSPSIAHKNTKYLVELK
jgi:ABC-type cobalamin/Fe3+-siderophores transport system ATPase subunit